MRSSVSSSARERKLPSAAPARRSFALTGRSRAFDPTREAIRPDIADVRLAEKVFAPHYAEAVPFRLVHDAALRADRKPDGGVLVTLHAGDVFELLDVTGAIAWGVAPASGFVGYLDADALGQPA
ncbi:SH3 domain-containing protein [Sphingomonas sp. TZW2008]|uniref:SH3 domain-containing protein n=1 Tax=Sphingomonas sp. TZW2008 TaxID=1917973 RepID=UPI00211A1004|nr:SH3 domain-containing protein [Sphingomonas sp. TZW2008]